MKTSPADNLSTPGKNAFSFAPTIARNEYDAMQAGCNKRDPAPIIKVMQAFTNSASISITVISISVALPGLGYAIFKQQTVLRESSVFEW